MERVLIYENEFRVDHDGLDVDLSFHLPNSCGKIAMTEQAICMYI